jgi:hypothetical protein
LFETSGRLLRLLFRMKKLLVLSTVLLGTAVASQAGIDVHIGIPLPPLPHIVIGHPAPPVVVQPPPVVYAPAPAVCAPAPVVVAPPTVYAPPPVIYGPPVAVVRPMPRGYYKHWLHRNERWHH